MLQREAIFSDPYNRMITFVEEYILIQHVGDETDALWLKQGSIRKPLEGARRPGSHLIECENQSTMQFCLHWDVLNMF